MLWSELDLDAALWTIGKDRTKNGLPHDVPLSSAAVAILRGFRGGTIGTSFSARATGRFRAGRTRRRRSTPGCAALKAERGDGAKLSPWRLHDIRRTVATRLGDQGALPHVVEAILNHISGHRAGVAGIYNRAIYAAEKREALVKWAETVAANGAGG